MLYETLAIVVLITPISATSAWSLRKDVRNIWSSLVLLLGPIIDAWLVWLLLNWLEIGFMATWGCTLSAGIISSMLLQRLL